MAFLNPLLLFGLAAILIPPAIHLLARRPAMRTSWAAMRFLKAAVERNQRRSGRENRILLALRCAFLALLALALARPAWRRGGFADPGSNDVATILLLDQSASMAQTDGATSRFEKAQQAAEQVLDSLPGGSAVAVWLVSDGVKEVVPEPARDFSLARSTIRAAIRTDRGTEWPPAIQRALEVLAQQGAARKRMYIVTDGQAAGWKNLESAVTMLGAAAKTVQTRVVLAGETGQRNLAVTNLRLASDFAPLGESLSFEVEVGNFGVEEARHVAVTLAADADTPSDTQMLESIAVGASQKLSLVVTLRDAGFHTITARVPGDRDPADDARTIALRASGGVNVLFVDGDPGAQPTESDVFHLRNALVPVPPEQRGKYFIKTKTVSPAELETQKLADFQAVVLANVAEVSEAALAPFEKYLRAGGGLLVFPGAKTNTAFYNEKMSAEHAFLPATFAGAHGDAGQPERFFQLQSKGYTHSIVEPWNEAAAGTLGTARFFRAFTLVPGKPSTAPGDAGPPELVLAYADGQPAVMERTWGRGLVVQFSSTAGSHWNDLCVRPAYVPLMRRVLGAILARQNEPLNGRCGSKFSLPVEAGGTGPEVQVLKPGVATASTLRIATGNAQIEFDDTDRAGVYEVRPSNDTAPILRFATQGERDESRLAELSDSEIKALEPVAQVVRWTTAPDFRATLERERNGVEFWLLLALLGIVAAVSETMLGNRWSQPK